MPSGSQTAEDEYKKSIEAQQSGIYIPNTMTPEEVAEWNARNNPGGTFGDKMRQFAMQNRPMVGVNHDQIADARQLTAQSYGQQHQATGMMRQLAMGQGPSVAATHGQVLQDQALGAALAHRGAPMLPGAASGSGMYAAANQGAGERGQEISGAQQGWGGAANTMRGQSLQDMQQAYNARYGASALNMSQQQQNLDRQLKMQNLSQGGYQMDSGANNEMANINSGFYADELQRQQAAQAAYLQAISSGAAQGIQYGFGNGDNSGGKK